MDKKTVKDIFDTLNDDQKQVFYYMLGCALDSNGCKDALEQIKEALETDMDDIREGGDEDGRDL